MKLLLLFVLLLSITTVKAGYYGNTTIDHYDPDSGFYYKAIVRSQEDSGFLSSKKRISLTTNIAIFDPVTNQDKLLFKVNKERHINLVLFETVYKKQAIQFYGGDQRHIKNNQHVPERTLRNKLLIGIRNNKKRQTELWVAHKNGDKLSPLAQVSFDSTWHLDIKHSKLRVITIKKGTFNIKNYPW